MNSCRRIAHLDMDAFFASVELLHYPGLRGEAVVVGGRRVDTPLRHSDGEYRFSRLRDYMGRGVVTTSTYEARALGVFSGMGLMKSAQLAPDAILLPANFDAYRDYSRRFKAAVRSICPRIEDRGIDEIYLDLTEDPGETHSLARRIKAAVFEATGLSCSIGIAPNKLLAKIASDLEKPDGLTVLAMSDLPSRLWPLPVRKINGIGPKATEHLARLGIATIGQLAETPAETLWRKFGPTFGAWLHRVAQGIDERSVVTESEPKSISRETTFDRDMHAVYDRSELSGIFTALCHQLAEDLGRKGYACRTIGIKLRYSDFRVLTRDISVASKVTEGGQIRKLAGECLKRAPLTDRLRLLGVRASGLERLGSTSDAIADLQKSFPF